MEAKMAENKVREGNERWQRRGNKGGGSIGMFVEGAEGNSRGQCIG